MCDSGQYVDSISFSFDQDVLNVDNNGISAVRFRCSDPSDQENTRSDFKEIGTAVGTY